MNRAIQRLVLSTACLLPCLTGCASMTEPVTTWMEEEPEYVTPSKVIPIWSDTILNQAGHKAERGCGGRLMFYAGESRKSVRVDGSLVVYAWNDSSDNHKRKPDRRYVFRMEDMQKHYSPSSVGESYSFWIPWDAAGGDRTELTLVTRFIGRNGAEVVSTPAKVILPGDVPMPGEGSLPLQEESVDAPMIRQASFATDGPLLAEKQSPADTIRIGEGFISRNMQGALSPDDLFDASDSAAHETQAVDVAKEAPTASTADNANTVIESQDRSLRFQHRVQTTREARQSVGRALSERYQSGGRRAPWDQD